jgi:hypothetical protein
MASSLQANTYVVPASSAPSQIAGPAAWAAMVLTVLAILRRTGITH